MKMAECHPNENKHGKMDICKKCYLKDYYLRNFSRIKARQHKNYVAKKGEYAVRSERWRKANPDRTRAFNRKFYSNNPDFMKDRQLKKTHNLSLVDYNKLLEVQGGNCAICLSPETEIFKGKLKRLAVDHDHATGLIRGLLCGKCNKGLGHFQDSVDLLSLAAQYLTDHKP